MNDIKKTVLSKFVVQTPTLEANEINTNTLHIDGKDIGEIIDEVSGSNKNVAKLDEANTFTEDNTFTNVSAESISATNISSSSVIVSESLQIGEKNIEQLINDEAEANENIAKRNTENTFAETNTFNKEVKLSEGAETQNSITVRNGNVIVHKGGNITFLDDGEIEVSPNASGSLLTDYSDKEIWSNILDHNQVYNFGVISDTKDLSSMEFLASGYLIQTCEIWFETGTTVPTIIWPNGTYWIESPTGAAPTLNASTRYRIALRSEIDTIVASVSYSYKKA